MKNLIEKVFENKFNPEDYKLFVRNLFNEFDFEERSIRIPSGYEEHIKELEAKVKELEKGKQGKKTTKKKDKKEDKKDSKKPKKDDKKNKKKSKNKK